MPAKEKKDTETKYVYTVSVAMEYKKKTVIKIVAIADSLKNAQSIEEDIAMKYSNEKYMITGFFIEPVEINTLDEDIINNFFKDK